MAAPSTYGSLRQPDQSLGRCNTGAPMQVAGFSAGCICCAPSISPLGSCHRECNAGPGSQAAPPGSCQARFISKKNRCDGDWAGPRCASMVSLAGATSYNFHHATMEISEPSIH